MSGLYENLPFARGNTYGTTDTAVGTHLEGREYIHLDNEYGTGKYVKVRIVRNSAAAALLPKRVAQLDAAAGTVGRKATGYTTTSAAQGYVIDELLPAAGVAVGDLFYVVVEGPTVAKTDLAGADNNVIAAGTFLHALTAATSGATTAGRVYVAAFTGATAVLAGQVQGVIGRALSARTTANTNADLLIDAGKF
jgi:hypothetical protein